MKTIKQQRLAAWASAVLLMQFTSWAFAQESTEKNSTGASSAIVTLPLQWTLTDTKGRSIEVDILSATDKQVKIRRRSNGKEHDIPLGSLCKKDQRFVKDLLLLSPSDSSAKTKPSKAKEDKSSDSAAVPAPQPELPQKLFKNIPPLEEQLADLTMIADQFLEAGRDGHAKTLLNRIEKARGGNLDALVNLSFSINHMEHLGFPDGRKCAFDVLRIPLAKDHPMALNMMFRFYGWNGGIPPNYVDECYVITKLHAEQGNPAAMLALGEVLIDGRGRPSNVQRNALIGCEWIEKSLDMVPRKVEAYGPHATIAKGYRYSKQYEKALPLLTATAKAGNPHNMQHLANLYYYGHGCERDLSKAVKWYEMAAAKGVDYGNLARAKNQLKYGQGKLKGTFDNADISLEIFGLENSKKAVVIFGSTGFKPSSFYTQLSELEALFQDGWNVIVVSYPDTDLFTTAGNTANVWHRSSAKFKEVNFTGFGEAVFNPIKNSDRFERIVLLGNSLGAGAMAWDLEKIQKSQNVSVLWISPTEVFLPKYVKLKALKGIKIVANLEGDPFVRSSQLTKWISSNTVTANSFGRLSKGHLILGENLPWKRLVDYLTKHAE